MNAPSVLLALCLALPIQHYSPFSHGADSGIIPIVEIDSISKLKIPRQTATPETWRFREGSPPKRWLDEVRFTLLGKASHTRDVLILFHGDTPSYYDEAPVGGKGPDISGDFSKLQEVLSSIGEGLLVVQPLASERDWYSLYRPSPDDPRGAEVAKLKHQLYDTCRKQLSQKEVYLHLHSFSGAGRVDRAWHDYFEKDPRGRALLEKDLRSWTVSDSMVNNSFSNAEKRNYGSVLATSWAHFLHRHPRLPVTFIYDRNGEYPYMQGVNLDVFRFLRDLRETGKITSGASVRLVENGSYLRTVNTDQEKILLELASLEGSHGPVTLDKADGHLHTFLGKISEAYLNHAINRKSGQHRKEPQP